MKKIIFLCALLLLSFAGYANEQKEKPAHKSPILTTTAIIEVHEGESLKAPFGKAIPGGKVEYGETVENAVRREMREEVNLELIDLKQFHVYSDPTRDFRHHSVEICHIAKAFHEPIAGDDAKAVHVVKLEDIPWTELAFDHAQILNDYMEWKRGNEPLSMAKP
jgi:ADP-ribose pyrophosphatase YjhB (NUDIX family)